MDIEKYLALIPSENRYKPRFRAWLSFCLGLAKDISDCAESMQKAFSVDHAVGKQLDIVGVYAGVSRKLPFQPVESSRYLSDLDYRKLIRATIAQTQWDGTNETLPHLLSGSFPEMGIVITDNLDMSVTAIARGSFSTLQLEMLNADLLLPRPAGVSMIYEVPTEIQETQIQLHGGVMVTSHQQIREE